MIRAGDGAGVQMGGKDSTAGDSPRTATQVTGDAAEAFASDWLARHGVTTIKRNVRYRGGEIDLVCSDGDSLVFVEVRLRSSARFGGAGASITAAKRTRIVLAAKLFLAEHPQWGKLPARFDCMLLKDLGASEPEWIRNAFDAA